jgi:hypothetical protein
MSTTREIIKSKPILNRRLNAITPPNMKDNQARELLGDMGLLDILNTPIQLPSLLRDKVHSDQRKILRREVGQCRNYQEHPLDFFYFELGIPTWHWPNDCPPADWVPGMEVPIWSKQREIVEALVKHKKVTVKSGHGVGKSFICARLALYLHFVHHAIGLTTAPTFRQVRRILWSEIHHAYNNAVQPLGGKLNQVSLESGDRWFIEGFATDKPTTNIQGIHEENVFVIIDEAGGVDPSIFDALDAVLTSKNSFVLYIGNPIEPSGPFYESFKPDSGFYPITISCYDCPNVKHNRIIYPKLTTAEWVADKEIKWRNTPLWPSRVLGEFPDRKTDALIPLKYIQAALDRELPEDKILSFGLDVARLGQDRSVYSVRYKSGKVKILDVTQQERIPETAGRMKGIYNAAVGKVKDIFNIKVETKKEDEGKEEIIPVVNVDSIGVGGGVADLLIEDNIPANEINVGELPDTRIDPDLDIFLNKRAQYYFKLRDKFVNGEIAIDNEELALELSAIKARWLPSGKIKIIDKELIRKELGKSPDLAESVMLAVAEEPDSVTEDLVRWV